VVVHTVPGDHWGVLRGDGLHAILTLLRRLG
jgi:hypothetical protein